ncbi:hypothetical protein, partial [Komagataeibacter xylinus]
MKQILQKFIMKRPPQNNSEYVHKINDYTIFIVCMMAFFSCTILTLFQIRSIDYNIEIFLNSFARKSKFVNALLSSLTYDSMTVGVLMAAIFYVWFNDKKDNNRKEIITGTVISFFSGALSRIVQLAMPSHLI